jgi:UDP-N-acetyl-2-amino-2-deoxyglucuronate dehydrogenase
MSKIRFAVVGFGHIGRKHAFMVQGNPDCELVAVIDTLEEARERAGEMGCPVFDSIQAYIDSGIEADVVNVCTPNGTHAELSIKALENKSHVIVEKPMALNKADCEEIIYKSLQAGRNVFCVKQNRYSPTSEWLKSLMNEKRLGEIYMVQMNCYWNRDNRYYKKGGWKGTKDLDGGVLFTQFSHFIDIMYWLMGDVKDIHGQATNFSHRESTEFDDSGIVYFKFKNGAMGSINFTTSIYGQNMESSIAIIGSKGSVKVSGQYMDQVSYCHIEDYEMPELPPANPPNDYGDYKGSAANHHYVIDNVINTLQGKDVISTNALEGMKVVEIIERMYEAFDA